MALEQDCKSRVGDKCISNVVLSNPVAKKHKKNKKTQNKTTKDKTGEWVRYGHEGKKESKLISKFLAYTTGRICYQLLS